MPLLAQGSSSVLSQGRQGTGKGTGNWQGTGNWLSSHCGHKGQWSGTCQAPGQGDVLKIQELHCLRKRLGY